MTLRRKEVCRDREERGPLEDRGGDRSDAASNRGLLSIARDTGSWKRRERLTPGVFGGKQPSRQLVWGF